MRLSVIIVSYNVYAFLDNCLRSVHQAMVGMDGEIIVVDNASVDRTQQLITSQFPEVKLIKNVENVGFAKANNQAINISRGEYILLLNPDTIVEENTFRICFEFMEAHPDAGAIGVRMIDGSGKFLPESKRGLPTLSASFMKMSGLYKFFPHSGFMNSYYHGEIDQHQTAEIEVLCGAFMFIRKSALESSGLLDEDFFMYGEDIDLSYRIRKAGYRIYYVPTTSIIHYKGESTKKSSLNYILTFYQAMLTFTKKHSEFRGQQFLLKAAIYLHGFIQFIRQTARTWWPPIMDAVFLSVSFYLVSYLWANYYFQQPEYFHSSFYFLNIPLYTLIGIASMYLNGAYDKPYSQRSSWLGFGWSVVSILVIYSLLPVHLRTSRMVIVLGLFIYMVLMIVSRWKIKPWKAESQLNQLKEYRNAIIVGGIEESNRIKELINRSRDHIEIIGTVTPDSNISPGEKSILGHFIQLQEIVRVHRVREIIFSAQDVPFSLFTSAMASLGPNLRYMLAASGTMNIVGSMNKDTEGESYAIRINFKLSHPASRRAKRIFDLIAASVLLFMSPLIYFLVTPKKQLWNNLLKVFSGRYTWVSYHPDDPMIHALPSLKPGILTAVFPNFHASGIKKLEHIDFVYARDYHWTTDLSLLSSQWNKLGQNPVSNE